MGIVCPRDIYSGQLPPPDKKNKKWKHFEGVTGKRNQKEWIKGRKKREKKRKGKKKEK